MALANPCRGEQFCVTQPAFEALLDVTWLHLSAELWEL